MDNRTLETSGNGRGVLLRWWPNPKRFMERVSPSSPERFAAYTHRLGPRSSPMTTTAKVPSLLLVVCGQQISELNFFADLAEFTPTCSWLLTNLQVVLQGLFEWFFADIANESCTQFKNSILRLLVLPHFFFTIF
jgi:hypothetical protein